jgi:enoyl-CoA hydratase
VMRGSGDRAFIGGADIKEMVGFGPADARDFITKVGGLCEIVRQFPAPVIARLSGWCLGAGVEVAAACDVRIASADAHFGMPEVAVGIPSVVHAVLLPRMIGAARARWLLLTARSIDAATALAWGLVDELAGSAAELDAAVAATTRHFVDFGPAAVRKQKVLLNRWEEMPLHAAIADSIDEFASSFDTGEPQQFMGDFVARKTRPADPV